MLYIFGKISQCGISFNIVYNESGHKNMKNVEDLGLHGVAVACGVLNSVA